MAADSGTFRHNPGTLKQQNKVHKHGKHKTKGQMDRETKGRVNIKVLTRKTKHVQKKNDRRYKAQQLQKQKREEVLAKKRSRGGHGTPPHFVVIVTLDRTVDTKAIMDLLKTCEETLVVYKQNEQGIQHISVPRFKQRMSFYCPPHGNLYALLDAAKIADCLLCVLSTDRGIDDYGEQCLSCLFGQGLPAVTLALQGLKTLPQKKQHEVRKFVQKKLEKRFPAEKFHSLDSAQDALLVMRQITSQKLRPIYYRQSRPHLVAENVTFEVENSDSKTGTLKLTGYLRGRALSVNGLVHLTGWGNFQMLQIDAPKDPHPLNTRYNNKPRKKSAESQDVEMESRDEADAMDEVRILERADPSHQESLQSEVVPDLMEGEQTWPTEEELAQAEAEINATKRIVKRVPKGTSEYQAAWIIDSEDEWELDEEEEEEDEDEDESMEAKKEEDSEAESEGQEEEDSEAESEGQEEEEYENITITAGDNDAKYDADLDIEEEQKILEKIKKEKENVMFPDEIDTPMDKTARTRFARYRGLKSFRTSPWDPKENLPADYARIFQFGNFKRTRKRVLAESEDADGAMPGWYITVHIANVPRAFMESYTPGIPVIMLGLLPHEQKMSVLNFVLKKFPDFTTPVQSKERLIFHVGFQRFSACPVLSQHTNANKHKFERFMPQDGAFVATVFAPVTFPPAPVLVFKESDSGEHELLATGSLLSVDPDRLVIKRIILSGYSFKIHRKLAVIRYMFFNREDILWFKPVELKTKWGRRGHIKEPLGTHGHMKCIFDGHLKSQDTVLMCLYKRVYPKWTYDPHVQAPPTISDEGPQEMEESEGPAFSMFD